MAHSIHRAYEIGAAVAERRGSADECPYGTNSHMATRRAAWLDGFNTAKELLRQERESAIREPAGGSS